MEPVAALLAHSSLGSLLPTYLNHETEILHGLAAVMVVTGVAVFCILLYTPATYGRYSSTTRFYSFGVPVRLAWFVQEVPSVLVPALLLSLAYLGHLAPKYDMAQIGFLSLFLIHYSQRSLVYPFLIRGGKPTPLYAFLSAFVFCTVNGLMQARGAVRLSEFSGSLGSQIRVGAGVFMFFFGFIVNVHSDRVLRNLRKPGETGYKIPTGGLFCLVSCANFLGEIVEWFGFALAAWSSVSFAFAFFTFANLVPRALFHHRWYVTKFEDYPKSRKAVIPYLL